MSTISIVSDLIAGPELARACALVGSIQSAAE